MPRGPAIENAVHRASEEESARQLDSDAVAFYEAALRDKQARYSGTWWSRPGGENVVVTSRSGPGELPCFELATEEDADGTETFEIWDLQIRQDPRVHEITSPKDWGYLVDMAPLDVTITRDADWSRWTGLHGPWLLPDWRIVAEAFDAVHVTIGGYLATRGVATEIERGFTFLAGWSAESTLWLRDMFTDASRAGTWTGQPAGDGLPEPFRLS